MQEKGSLSQASRRLHDEGVEVRAGPMPESARLFEALCGTQRSELCSLALDR